MSTPQTWYLYEDPELKLVHTTHGCPEAKVAKKYNYLKTIKIKTVQDAEALDRRASACPRCVKVEAAAMKRSERSRKRYVPPPGFRGGAPR